jgi:hypothetical protein
MERQAAHVAKRRKKFRESLKFGRLDRHTLKIAVAGEERFDLLLAFFRLKRAGCINEEAARFG